jgi:septal ring factor EnvC (AmiA/AmiB activator)
MSISAHLTLLSDEHFQLKRKLNALENELNSIRVDLEAVNESLDELNARIDDEDGGESAETETDEPTLKGVSVPREALMTLIHALEENTDYTTMDAGMQLLLAKERADRIKSALEIIKTYCPESE